MRKNIQILFVKNVILGVILSIVYFLSPSKEPGYNEYLPTFAITAIALLFWRKIQPTQEVSEAALVTFEKKTIVLIVFSIILNGAFCVSFWYHPQVLVLTYIGVFIQALGQAAIERLRKT